LEQANFNDILNCERMMSKVYLPMIADILHPKHLELIYQGRKLGKLIIGLQTDKAISTYQKLPIHSYEERKEILSNIIGVDSIVPQNEINPKNNIMELKPDYFLYTNSWKIGYLQKLISEINELMKSLGGVSKEIIIDKSLDSNKIIGQFRSKIITPDIRRGMLRRLIRSKEIVRVIEAHNGLSGLIAENAQAEKDGKNIEYDAIWESSLTDSASKGKPDISAVDITSRIQTIDQILDVTTKPMIVDADNGGMTEIFTFNVKTLERLGVSAVIIEDKKGLKRNSLFGTSANQAQDTIEEFCNKISSGKKAQHTEDFMIFARIESLILEMGMDDALKRAKKYILAGADGIMIHSKQKTPEEIFEFARKFRSFDSVSPLVVVPSTYSSVTESKLIEAGINVVIYANQLLRASYPAMLNVANSILQNERCFESDEEYCMSIKEILNLIPES